PLTAPLADVEICLRDILHSFFQNLQSWGPLRTREPLAELTGDPVSSLRAWRAARHKLRRMGVSEAILKDGDCLTGLAVIISSGECCAILFELLRRVSGPQSDFCCSWTSCDGARNLLQIVKRGVYSLEEGSLCPTPTLPPKWTGLLNIIRSEREEAVDQIPYLARAIDGRKRRTISSELAEFGPTLIVIYDLPAEFATEILENHG
ncbi:hypothetical protein FOZ60_017147, partial [Perkinsus olseni]